MMTKTNEKAPTTEHDRWQRTWDRAHRDYRGTLGDGTRAVLTMQRGATVLWPEPA